MLRSNLTGDIVHSAPLVSIAEEVEKERTMSMLEAILHQVVGERYSQEELDTRIENR